MLRGKPGCIVLTLTKGYCESIVHNQVREIDDMRDMLCERFSVCDYQPAMGMRMQPNAGAASRQ